MTRPWFLLSGGTLLGLTGEYLMRAPLGVNVPIFTAVFIVVTARATSISPFHSGLALPMIFFAGCIAWRESMFLTASNTFVVLGLAGRTHDTLAGAKVVLAHELTGAIMEEFQRRRLKSRDVPDKFFILRTLQFITEYRRQVIQHLS